MILPAIRFLRVRNNSSLNEFLPGNGDYDFTEKEAARGVEIARDMLAVEDASEIAKSYMFESDVFERILKDIGGKDYTTHCSTFSNRTLKKNLVTCGTRKSKDIIHIGYVIGNDSNSNSNNGNNEPSGHYSGAVREGNTVRFFDSMCTSAYGPRFKGYIRKRYGNNVKIVQDFPNNYFQPSGGFAPESIRNFKSMLRNSNLNVSDDNIGNAFRVSQYDLLSQHHFCYIESLVYLFHKKLGTSIGPSGNDPEKRLKFIKAVMWALIFKYARPETKTHKFKYFHNNFKYYLTLTHVRYHTKGFYLPTRKGDFSYALKKINMMPPSRAKNATIKQIIDWAVASSR